MHPCASFRIDLNQSSHKHIHVFSFFRQSFQVDSKKAADSLLSQAPSEVAKLQSTFVALFAMEPLSKTRQSFASCNGSKNSALEEALSQTLDAVDGTLTSINAIERYM